jgi:hypothetical protein
MMQVDLNKIAVTSDGLFLGLVVRYGESGPVRFAQVRIEDDVLDWQALQDLTSYLNRQIGRHLDRERDVADFPTLPGM